MTLTNPTDAEPLVWEFDLIDDGAGNKRVTGALRDVGGSGTGNQAFFEMGRFNNISNPEDTANPNISGYGFRHAFVGGAPAGNSGWLSFVGNPLAVAGTHHMRATIGDTTALFELDLNDDGTVDGSRTITMTAGETKAYNLVRFGGPSDVSSLGGGLNFDNLSIQTIPEPTAFALVGLGGVGLLARRRRST